MAGGTQSDRLLNQPLLSERSFSLRNYRNELGLLVAVLAVIAVTMTVNDAYWKLPWGNAQDILRQSALLGIFALGVSVVIIGGGIDLSAGAMIAFAGSVCAEVMIVLSPVDSRGIPDTSELGIGVMAAGIAAAIAVGFLVGTLHTWLITVIGLPPFVATLASLVGLRSLAKLMNQEVTRSLGNQSTKININDLSFIRLGDEWWIPFLVFLATGVVIWLLMNRTVVGRHIYAMGGNENAAKLSGIRTDRLKWLTYCISAITAAIAGVLYTANVGSADPQTQGNAYELYGIAAAVVGGCSLQGGIGSIVGVMLGVLFLRVVIDAVAKIAGSGSDDYQGIIVGFLVVLAVALNEFRFGTGRRKQFFPGMLGWFSIFALGCLAAAVAAVLGGVEQGWGSSMTTGVVVAAVLTVLKLAQSRAQRLAALG